MRLTPSAYFSVRGGFFHDRYTDTGIPQTTNYRYGSAATAELGIPATLQGPLNFENTPRALITEFDTTKRSQLQRRLQPLLQRARHPLAAGRLRLPARGQRHQLVLSRRLRRSPVRPLLHLRRRHDRHGHLRVLRRPRPAHHEPGRQRHPLALRPGSVDGRQPPDAEPGPPDGKREHPGLPARGRWLGGDQVQHGGQARAAPRRGVRRLRQRPHEGVRQLGPLLRLDQVRAAARIVRRRDLVHQLSRARYAGLRQPEPEQHAWAGSVGHAWHVPRPPLPGRSRSRHQADAAVEHQRRRRVPARPQRRPDGPLHPQRSARDDRGHRLPDAAGRRRLRHRQSREWPQRAAVPVGRHATRLCDAAPEASVRCAGAGLQQALRQQLVLQRQLHAEPALWQLRGSRVV